MAVLDPGSADEGSLEGPGYQSCPEPGLDSWLSELRSSTMQQHYNHRTSGTSGGWHWQINVRARRSTFISSCNYIQINCQNSQKRVGGTKKKKKRETRRFKFLQSWIGYHLHYLCVVCVGRRVGAHAQACWYLNVDSMPSTRVPRHSVFISSHSSKHTAWNHCASSLLVLDDNCAPAL